MNTGTKANKNGRGFENYITLPFLSKGFVIAEYNDWHHHNNAYGKDLLIHNYPYYDITNTKGKMEYFILSETYGLKSRIECKWQGSHGSVDEKLPKLYLDCIGPGNPDHSIIIIDGGGHRKRYIEWLKHAAASKLYINDSNNNKHVDIMSLVEFINWVNNLPKYKGKSIFSSVVLQESVNWG